MGKLYAPNGKPIIGTAETVAATAFIRNQDVVRNADGTFSFDWSLSRGTEIAWDSQVTVTTDDDQRVFLDIDYNEWPEGSLELRHEVADGNEE